MSGRCKFSWQHVGCESGYRSEVRPDVTDLRKRRIRVARFFFCCIVYIDRLNVLTPTASRPDDKDRKVMQKYIYGKEIE